MSNIKCRGCFEGDLEEVYNFGDMPLAGEFLANATDAKACKRYSLILNVCKSCGLMQINNAPPIHKIFHDNYNYATGEIAPLVQHFSNLARFIGNQNLSKNNILEFGCNDGTHLTALKDLGLHVIGVDASLNMVERARAKGLDVHHGFFGSHDFGIPNNYFGAVTCSNVFAHIDDIAQVSREVHRILVDGGLFFIEVHNGNELLPNQYDSIYHEHLTYFTEDSITTHLKIMNFDVISIDYTEMHGSGLRVIAKKTNAVTAKMLRNNSRFETKDLRRELDSSISTFNNWAYEYLDGRLVDIYGASGRAQMFLNMTSLGKIIDKAFDDAPIRQGKYLAGIGKLVEAFNGEKRDICIITAWNYSESILNKIKGYYKEVYIALPKIARIY